MTSSSPVQNGVGSLSTAIALALRNGTGGIQHTCSALGYLIDPFAVGDLAPLQQVMNGPRPKKVIHNARFERGVLAAVGIALDGVFDTLEASCRVRGQDAIGGHGLAMVCERELGVSLDKGEQTSNWSRRPLDANQLRYAALDAEVLLAVFDRFSSGAV